MKNTVLITILFSFLSLNSFSQADVSRARSLSSTISIDGIDNDWEQPLNLYDDNSGLLFAIGNDRENLFLCFTVKEELKMKKLMSAGWSIGLSSKDKQKKFKAELSFPGYNVMGMRSNENKFEKKSGSLDVVKSYQLQMTKISCSGFRSNIANLTLNGMEPIQIGINADSTKHIVYEIRIPLKELFGPVRISLNEQITMNVKVNALDRPSPGGGSGNRPPQMGGGRSGGGMPGGRSGGGHGGGMGGGMRGEGGNRGEQGDRSNLFGQTSFKQKFTLTVN